MSVHKLILAKRSILHFLFTVLLVSGLASLASAQSRAGVRAGISVDPEQFYFGAHADVAEVVRRFWFRPNFEVGFGDSRTVAGFNGEFVYLIPVRSRDWHPYFGGGPALVLTNFRGPRDSRDTDVGPGFNFVGGVQRTKGLLAEVKVGALDSPGFKLGIGWTW